MKSTLYFKSTSLHLNSNCSCASCLLPRSKFNSNLECKQEFKRHFQLNSEHPCCTGNHDTASGHHYSSQIVQLYRHKRESLDLLYN